MFESARLPAHRRRRAALVPAVVGALVVSLAAVVTAVPAGAAAPALPVVEDFEGAQPITTTSPGIFPFGNDAASTPALGFVAAADLPGAASGNQALDVPYTISQYGGFSDNLSASQNWAGYGGFRFWVKGSNTGQRIEFEIKDGGTDGEHSELWQGFFNDDSSGWKQVSLPFANFVKRTDYQPPGGPSDGVLNLTAMWGFAINIPPGAGDLKFDNVEVYGTAVPRVAAATTTYLVDPGDPAHVAVTVSTADGRALADPVSVAWTLGGGSAVAGADYKDDSGTLAFPAGTASGTTKTIDVVTIGGTPAATAKTIPVTLKPSGATLTGSSPTVVINAHGLPYQDKSLSTAARVRDLMSRMSLADKVGQMTQAERLAIGDGTDIGKYRLGSLLSGGGSTPTPNTPAAWADMIDAYQTQALATPLQIPMIYGIDSVHGDNNLAGATLFPHNIGMGATRDPALVEQEGAVTATETRATGIPWAFAPCVCVTRDERWGRQYESYSEDPALVSLMAVVVKGLQHNGELTSRDSVLATAKHFLGDGGTKYGSSTNGTYTIDQGVTYVTQQQLDTLFVAPFRTAVKDGVGSVMPSYSSLQILGKDSAPVKMHARTDMITGLLKQKLGFKGFVISDYAAIDQIGPDYKTDVKIGINAGLDMIMVPNNYTTFIADLTELVNSGDVPMSRINDAVTRILTQKFALGLFDHPFADRTNIATIGSAAHRAIARRAAAESQVLLKNVASVLPLSKTAKVYVAGSNADDEGNQSGGWTLTWQGQSGDIPGATSILQGMRKVAPAASITYSKDASASMAGYHLGVVVVGETPYAEGMGDVGNNGHTLQLSVADRDAVDKVCAAMRCVVLDVSGRPQDITGIVPAASGVVASWLPGSEGEGVADVLFGNRPFTGRLPETWAKASSQIPINVGDTRYDPLYPYGWGLRTDGERGRLTTLRTQLSEQGGNAAVLASLNRALTPAYWNSAGIVTLAGQNAVLSALTEVAYLLTNSRSSYAQRNAVVSVARDMAQSAVVYRGSGAMSATAAMTANADHALANGHPGYAVKLLKRARDKARTFASGATRATASGTARVGVR